MPMRLVDPVIEQLKEDRMIQVFIDGEAKPYMLPQSTLKKASQRLCADISEDQTLSLHEDDKDACKVLLYYLVQGSVYEASLQRLISPRHGHEVSQGDFVPLYIYCWLLGEKYEIPKFQDAVMLELLPIVEEEGTPLRAIRDYFAEEPPPSASPLRRLMIEQILLGVRYYRAISYEDLEYFEDEPAFFSEFGEAAKKGEELGGLHHLAHFGYGGRSKEGIAAAYLVGEPPVYHHWLSKIDKDTEGAAERTA